MCSNVNLREMCDGKKTRGEKKDCAEPKFNREKRKPNREKIRKKRRVHEVARAWGRERERMRKSLKLNIV